MIMTDETKIKSKDYDDLCDQIRNLVLLVKQCDLDVENRMDVVQDFIRQSKRDRKLIIERIKKLETTLGKVRVVE